MDSPLGLLKFLFPKLPGMTKQALAHSLWMSPTSTKWDLRTELVVFVLRAMMKGDGPASIGQVQAQTLKDPGVKGKMWAAEVTIPAPSDDGTQQALYKAVDDMKEGDETYTKPESATMKAEWIAFRPNAGNEEPAPAISNEEKYKNLMEEPSRTSKITILYLHGGAYYLCGFGTHRVAVSKLAKACNGRALLIEYRLAPQTAFPGQLLDALNAYLYLLYPPPGSLHEPVPAKDIVFAGDSAGGNLAFALLQLLLQLHRTASGTPTIPFNGVDVPIPLPAAVSANSAWLDITRSQPSIVHNAKYDYLPPATHDDAVSRFAPDAIWPPTPPRGDVFADLSMLCHPLCSPLAAKDWTGSPPLWIETGEELLTDEDAVVAARAASQGVTVVWEQYEAMPHCFAMLLPKLPNSRRCVSSWGAFCRSAGEGDLLETKGTWIAAKTGEEKVVDVEKVTEHRWEDAVEAMREAQRRRVAGWEKEGKALPKPSL